jgi:hypothetical protein
VDRLGAVKEIQEPTRKAITSTLRVARIATRERAIITRTPMVRKALSLMHADYPVMQLVYFRFAEWSLHAH